MDIVYGFAAVLMLFRNLVTESTIVGLGNHGNERTCDI